MQRPDFDKLTDKEERQLGDFINRVNRKTLCKMARAEHETELNPESEE